MNKNDIKQIIFSIVFIILFGIIFGTETFDFVRMISNSSNGYEIILTILAMIVSATGIYVSLVYGIVKVINSFRKSGGNKNGKENKKQKN